MEQVSVDDHDSPLLVLVSCHLVNLSGHFPPTFSLVFFLPCSFQMIDKLCNSRLLEASPTTLDYVLLIVSASSRGFMTSALG